MGISLWDEKIGASLKIGVSDFLNMPLELKGSFEKTNIIFGMIFLIGLPEM